MMLAMSNNYNFALMGQPFFHGYYTHHQMDDLYMDIGPLLNGGSADLFYGDVPTKPLPGLKTATILQMVLALVYVGLCAYIGVMYVYPYLLETYDGETDSGKQTIAALTSLYVLVCFGLFTILVAPLIGITDRKSVV